MSRAALALLTLVLVAAPAGALLPTFPAPQAPLGQDAPMLPGLASARAAALELRGPSPLVLVEVGLPVGPVSGVLLELRGPSPLVLVEALAAADAGEGSRDRAEGAHLRAATHTVDLAVADVEATPEASRATAQAARVSLLDGAILLEAVTVEATAAGGRGDGTVTMLHVIAPSFTYVDAFRVGSEVPIPGGRLILGERTALPNGFRACAAHLFLDTGEEVLVLCATALAGTSPRAQLPPEPAWARASATTLEVTGGYRAGDDIAASADGAAQGSALGVLSRAEAASTGFASSASARVEVPSLELLNGLIEVRDLLVTAAAASDDTFAAPTGSSRVGEIIIDGTFIVSPVPQEWSYEIPGVGMLHANEVRLVEVEDPDTSTTHAAVEAVALRLVLLDGGEGVGRETSVGRVRAEAFAPRTPVVGLELREHDNPIRAGDVVTFEYTVRSLGTATLTEGVLLDDRLGLICTYRLLRPGEVLPCTRLAVVTQDFAHNGTTGAVDAWGASALAATRGFIEVIDA